MSPDTRFEDVVQQAREQSQQARAHESGVNNGGVASFLWMVKAGENISPWWSPTRDRQLDQFWKKVDYLSGAVYNMCAKMTAIPFKVIALDQSNKRHVALAEQTQDYLMTTAELGDGWDSFYEKFITDYIVTDNGAFAEIIGDGPKDGPIIGQPTSVAMLDACRCQRTGDLEYPVVYQDTDGSRWKLHWTRVMFKSSMPSTRAEMCGVGFSAVSRTINIAQSLFDILTYKGEKMGSRPHRGIIVTRGGLDPVDVAKAFEIVATTMDSQQLSRYSKIAVVGSSALPEAEIELTDLASLPDGFDERTAIELGMATIALGFGVDARDLFPGMSAGATRADALLQHMKQRGKGPGQIIQITESLFNQKYLNNKIMRLIFDFQDDAQDRQAADTKRVRSERHRTYTSTAITDNRTARLQMVEDGDLARYDFERLELNDGRLEDGTPVLALFFSEDPDISRWLDLGVEDPTNIEENSTVVVNPPLVPLPKEPEKKPAATKAIDPANLPTTTTQSDMPAKIRKNMAAVNRFIVNKQGNEQKLWKATQARGALEALLTAYQPPAPETGNDPAQAFNQKYPEGMTSSGTKARPHKDVRNQELTTPNTAIESGSDIRDHTSDEEDNGIT